MKYDCSRDALYRPYLLPPLDPALFKGKPDALCAELSRLAYFAFPPAPSALAAALAAHGLKQAVYFEDATTNTQAFAALDAKQTAHVVFRGTESSGTADLITDIAILRRNWDRGGTVHRGFANAYDSNGAVSAHDSEGHAVAGYHRAGLNLRQALRKWVADRGCKRLVATGHSLGGALATLFASDHASVELVTFGSPAVGNAAFAALFADDSRKVRRYRDCCDAVSRVPPGLIGYRPTKHEVYIDRNGKLHDPPPAPLAILADRAEAVLQYAPLALSGWSTVKARDLADHAPINYVSALLGEREAI